MIECFVCPQVLLIYLPLNKKKCVLIYTHFIPELTKILILEVLLITIFPKQSRMALWNLMIK